MTAFRSVNYNNILVVGAAIGASQIQLWFHFSALVLICSIAWQIFIDSPWGLAQAVKGIGVR